MFTGIKAQNGSHDNEEVDIWSNNEVVYKGRTYDVLYFPDISGGYVLSQNMVKHGRNEQITQKFIAGIKKNPCS